MRFCVGLTGGIGCGKSQATGMFAALGVDVVDTDAIAHELTAPGGLAMDLLGPDRDEERPPVRAALGGVVRGLTDGLHHLRERRSAARALTPMRRQDQPARSTAS